MINGDYGPDHISKMIKSSENGFNKHWRYCDEYEASTSGSSISISSELKPFEKSSLLEKSIVSSGKYHYAQSSWGQFRILVKRNIIKLSRDKVSLIFLFTLQ